MSLWKSRFGYLVATIAAMAGVLLASSPVQAGPGAANSDNSAAAVPGWPQYRPLHANQKCMAVWNNDMRNTSKVHLWQCADNNAAMEWSGVPADGNYYLIANARMSPTGQRMCLDVPWPNQGQGTQLQIYQCNGQSNQLWRSELSTEDGYRILVNKATGWLLDAANMGTVDGTPVVVWPHAGVRNQSWGYFGD